MNKERLESQIFSQKADSEAPLTKNAFASLALTLKYRFKGRIF